MTTVHRLQMPGRDTCAGTCETEAGCTCLEGCEGLCQQGRRTCQGKPLPMARGTAWLLRNQRAWGYITGAAAVLLVVLCIGLASVLAAHF